MCALDCSLNAKKQNILTNRDVSADAISFLCEHVRVCVRVALEIHHLFFYAALLIFNVCFAFGVSRRLLRRKQLATCRVVLMTLVQRHVAGPWALC